MDTEVGSTEVEASLELMHRTPSLFGYTNMRAGQNRKPWLDAWMVLKLRQIRPDVIHVPDVNFLWLRCWQAYNETFTGSTDRLLGTQYDG